MKEMDSQSKLSLKLQAYQYLKTKILNCEYRPNEFLNEQKLCAEMGNISRTPMRDALGRLEQEGLITILPKKGLMVSGITEEDVHSMFEMRLLVEPYALRTYGNLIPREQLEAYTELMHHPERIDDFCKSDDDFHELLMSSLPNKYLRSGYDRITGLNTRFRIMTGKVSMINQDQTCEEHLEILNAALSDNWNTAADGHDAVCLSSLEGCHAVLHVGDGGVGLDLAVNSVGEVCSIQQVGDFLGHTKLDQVGVRADKSLLVAAGGQLGNDVLNGTVAMVGNGVQNNAVSHNYFPPNHSARLPAGSLCC